MTSEVKEVKEQFNRSTFIASLFLSCLTVVVILFYAEQDANERVAKRQWDGIYQGWFLDRNMDLSDSQWRSWRNNLPILSAGMAAFIIGSWFFKYLLRSKAFASQTENSDENGVSYSTISFHGQMLFYALSGLGFAAFVHKFTVLYVLAVTGVSFGIGQTFRGSKWNPALTWIWNLFVLFSCDYFRGYHMFASMGDWGMMMDKDRGMLRWDVYFKMSMLRLISYNLDLYWAEKHTTKASTVGSKPSEYTLRVITHLPPAVYRSYINFLGYVFYIPLYIAGPIITFNAFTSQVGRPIKLISFKHAIKHILWVFLWTVVLEVVLHYNYLYSYNLNGGWKKLGPGQLMIVGMWTMEFMYMKFFCIWRFFRSVTLLDGIEAPENMIRCMCNNYTFTGFWKSWHASFNKWTVRYMYVPMGGTKTQVFTIWPIFFFIGLWHDLWWRWVSWALCNCVFFSIEMIIIHKFYDCAFYKNFREKYAFSMWLEAFVKAWNVALLVTANLAITHGFESLPGFIKGCFASEGSMLASVCMTVLIGGVVRFSMEVRRYEASRNITKKY